MNAKANYFVLGLFVIAGAAVLCMGVVALGAAKLFERTFTVETYMTESVDGIAKGSAVKYRGIELGQVTNVMTARRRYDRDAIKEGHIGTTVLVELGIRADAIDNPSPAELKSWLQKAVARGYRTRTASSGLTGPAYIELVYVDPAEFPPPAITWTPPDLYIPSAPSTTQVLISAVQNIAKKLEKLDLDAVVGDADKLLKNANSKLEALDVPGASEDAKKVLEGLRSKIDAVDTQKISDEAVAFLGEVRKSNDRLHQILDNPAIDPAIEDLRATLENAKKATARIDGILADPRVERLMTSLDQAGADLPPALQDFRRAIRRIDRLVETQQSTIESALKELNQALTNIKNLTDDASQNPSRILFGEPPPHVTPGAK